MGEIRSAYRICQDKKKERNPVEELDAEEGIIVKQILNKYKWTVRDLKRQTGKQVSSGSE